MEALRIVTGMPVSDRRLWFLAWNPRPLYVLAIIVPVAGVVFTHSPFGILFGVFPLMVLYKANQIVNATSPQTIECAKSALLKADAREVSSRRSQFRRERCKAQSTATP